MTRLRVVQLNDAMLCSQDTVLRQPSRSVDVDSEADLRAAGVLAREMLRVLFADPSGVALAAPQVGVLLQVVVVSFADRDSGQQRLHVLLNPSIVGHSDEQVEDSEICLSLPEHSGRVRRWRDVEVRAFGLDGTVVTLDASGFWARVLQHEIDHLRGVLYSDTLVGELAVIPDHADRRLAGVSRRLNLPQ